MISADSNSAAVIFAYRKTQKQIDRSDLAVAELTNLFQKL